MAHVPRSPGQQQPACGRWSLILLLLSLPSIVLARIENGPITPASVELNGVATATRLLDGTILGAPGIIVNRLQANEWPTQLVGIVSGRLGDAGIAARWDVYVESFEIVLYTVPDYTNGLPPAFTLNLARPVDTNNSLIGTVATNDSVMPDTPAYASLLSTTNQLTRYGYWLGFNFTTNPAAASNTVAHLPTNVLHFMRSQDFVLSFMTVADFGNEGGTRIAAQEPGFGQGALNRSTFHSGIQAPTIFDDGSFSYALSLNIVAEAPPTNAPVIVAIAGVAGGDAGLTATDLGAGVTSAVVAAATPLGPWTTATVFVATAQTHTVQIPATNPATFYRIEVNR